MDPRRTQRVLETVQRIKYTQNVLAAAETELLNFTHEHRVKEMSIGLLLGLLILMLVLDAWGMVPLAGLFLFVFHFIITYTTHAGL
jgi:hypothetical protein